MTGHRWLAPSVVAAVLAVGSLLVSSPGPVVGSDGPCPGTTGVTVVVDYHALGGGVVVRCAPGSPATGFKALQAAGFDLVEVQNVPGFLCRIDDKPSAAQEPCLNTPPANAYWSYWHADRGGSWAVSQQGGKTRKPPPGSVDGWSFGATPKPGIDPPAAPATPEPTAKPTPKPTPRPTAKPTAGPTSTASPAPTPRPTADATATARPTTAESSPPGPTPSPSGAAGATSSASPGTTLPASGATPAASPPDGTPPAIPEASASAAPGAGAPEPTSAGGPPFGTLVGLAIVGLVIVVGWSRRPSRRAGDG